MTWEAATAGSLADMETWYQANTGPRVPITGDIVASPYTISTQADADALVGKRVIGWIDVAARVDLQDFEVLGPPLDPDVYVYPIDASGYPSGTEATAKRTALNGMARKLINFQPSAAGTTVKYFRLDGSNERAYSGFGGASYADNIKMSFGHIRRTGDDGGKTSKNIALEYMYIDELRPWDVLADGAFMMSPNDVRYPHLDALQLVRGNCTIRRCFLRNTTTATATSGPFLAKPDTGEGSTEILFEENICFGGANYPIQLISQSGTLGGAGATLNGVVIRNNLISRDFGGKAAHPDNPFAVGSLYADQVAFSGNRWLEDRSPIPAPYMAPRP